MRLILSDVLFDSHTIVSERIAKDIGSRLITSIPVGFSYIEDSEDSWTLSKSWTKELKVR